MNETTEKEKFNAARFIVVAITIGYFLMIAGLYFVKIPAETAQILNTQIGAIGVSLGMIVGYHFGSSSGSAAKTAMLAAPTTVTTATPDKVETVTSPTPQPPPKEKAEP